MKNLFFALAFIFVGSVGFAGELYEKNHIPTTYPKAERALLSDNEFSLDAKSHNFLVENEKIIEVKFTGDDDQCIIRTATEIESNGEVTFRIVTEYVFNDISCEDLFCALSCISGCWNCN